MVLCLTVLFYRYKLTARQFIKETSMNQSTAIKLFQDRNVRVIWDEEQEKYYFSVIDVIAVLTDSDYQTARNYWKVLKHRLQNEGASQTVTNCNQLKMMASDGKMRNTDVADTEELLRIIQSIPSPKAEPFKLWLAKVGRERLDELAEVSTTEFSKEHNPETFEESKTIARKGGEVAKSARQNIEKQLGHKVVTPKNAKDINEIENPKQ